MLRPLRTPEPRRLGQKDRRHQGTNADAVEALRTLGAIARTRPLSSALIEWHAYVDTELRTELRSLAHRLALGQPAAEAVADLGGVLQTDASAFSAIVAVQARCGGDAAKMVESLADAAERRAEFTANAEAHGSGAKLSARLIAGLPLAFLPVTPMTRAPVTDRPGLLLLVCGVGLAVAGVAWISALFPKPAPHDDPAAVVAEVLACAVEGGGDVRSTLLDICSHPPPGVTQAGGRVRRLVALGADWNEALERSGDESLAALARSLAAGTSMGLPLAPVLRDFAALRRSQKEREFEAAVRRAPVRMAIPLAVCVLPSFVILGIGPFLRGLSLGA